MSFAARRGLLRTLVAHRVRFVLVGGMAVIAHGHVRTTNDLDLVYDTSLESSERFAAALDELAAAVISADTPPPDGRATAEWLAQGGHLVFATESGQLDAMSSTRGLGYEQLAGRAIEIELADATKALVCSYEDLIAMKSDTGRPQDLADIEALRALRAEGA